jgi:hypothetical protein
MAASKAQGKSFTLFLVGLTIACAGLAYFSSTLGKVSLLLGVVLLAICCWEFLKLKPLEGKVALGAQPAGMKLIGVLVVLVGWAIVLFGMHLTPSIAGRMAAAIVGLIVSLAGIVFILSPACNKNAIWKS